MLVDSNHTEPSNEEMGIKPLPKTIMWPLIAAVGIGMWYLLFVAFV